jgi:hypothetical protein
MPVSQAANIENGPTIVVRTPLDARAATSVVRETILAIDRNLPVDRIETMEQMLSRSVAQPRFRTTILLAFSILALAMASIGVYGVLNYLVSSASVSAWAQREAICCGSCSRGRRV